MQIDNIGGIIEVKKHIIDQLVFYETCIISTRVSLRGFNKAGASTSGDIF